MTRTHAIHVALAIIVRHMNGQALLIAQRPSTTIRPGAWEFPGGKIEPGESPADAAIRETHEELNLTIRVTHTLEPHTHTYTHATVTLHPCIAELDPLHQTPTLIHAADYRWVAPSDLPVPGFLEGNTPILAQLRAYLATPAARSTPQ